MAFLGTLNGREASVLVLENALGMKMEILSYGAILRSWLVPNSSGGRDNIVVGFNSLEEYDRQGGPYLGAFVGRVANRISGAKFALGGTTYSLDVNDGPRNNTLHGGWRGFNNKFYTFRFPSSQSVELSAESVDGEGGFPGNVQIRVRYTLTDAGEWVCEYFVTADQKTPVDCTQHTYFNLSGGNLRENANADWELQIFADRYLPFREGIVPSGEIVPVAGTPFDFRQPKAVGRDHDAKEPQFDFSGGYSHYYVLNRKGSQDVTPAAVVRDPQTGRTLEMATNQPGFVLFACTSCNGTVNTSQGKLVRRGAICLEAQNYPNAINEPSFPSPIIKAGETYYQKTVYRVRF